MKTTKKDTYKRAPEAMRFAVVAVDVVVFGVHEGELCALLMDVNVPPHFVGMQGFPGGLVAESETTDEAAQRHLKDKVGLVNNAYVEQLYTFSAVKRDRRNRVISVAHVALVRPDVVENHQFGGTSFVPVKDIKSLAFDHIDMLQVALHRLRGKLEYTNAAQFLLPRHFTLTELQNVYELVHKKEFDKRNFRKKILAMGIIKETGKMQEGVRNRPAALYTFTKTKLEDLPLFV